MKLHTLRVGDFFLADGRLLPYDTDKEKVQASNVVGIVFQTNPGRVGEAERKVLGGEAHALVMALKNAAVDVTFGLPHLPSHTCLLVTQKRRVIMT